MQRIAAKGLNIGLAYFPCFSSFSRCRITDRRLSPMKAPSFRPACPKLHEHGAFAKSDSLVNAIETLPATGGIGGHDRHQVAEGLRRIIKSSNGSVSLGRIPSNSRSVKPRDQSERVAGAVVWHCG
jgi:hypothetical protein